MRKLLMSFAVILLSVASAQAQAPFYQGKTITIIVGYLAGDGYDIWARLLAAHMGKHIPGNPDVIVQNMPGAGSMIAANHVYNVAKPDGLTLASIGPSLYLDQVVGKKEVQFDWAKFGWVGSTESTPWLFYMNTNTPFKTIDDVRKAKEAPKCSATSSGTSGHFIPKLLEEAMGAKFTVVMGYQGRLRAGSRLRARRGGLPRAQHPDFFRARAVYHLAQGKYGAHPVADRPQARREDARCADDP